MLERTPPSVSVSDGDVVAKKFGAWHDARALPCRSGGNHRRATAGRLRRRTTTARAPATLNRHPAPTHPPSASTLKGPCIMTVGSHPSKTPGRGQRGQAPRRFAWRPLTAATALALQSYHAYPSISILKTTRPGPTLDAADRAGLDTLVRQARRRLIAENPADATALADALTDGVAHLTGPIDRAVALFASSAHTARVDLPVDVVDRCVIDPTFATRDLLRALHRTPRHVVLLLGANEARLLDGAGGHLTQVAAGFPRIDLDHQPDRAARDWFLRGVDEALGAYRRLHPAPLIIAAAEPTLSAFRRMSRNTTRLAGYLTDDHLDTPYGELRGLVHGVVERYLRSRPDEALDLLANRTDEGRAVYGVDAAWFAARWKRPEMLAVEEGYFYPARVSPDGDSLTSADDPQEPDVCDDAVDELIETVISRGGWVALLADGSLPEHRVALALRST